MKNLFEIPVKFDLLGKEYIIRKSFDLTTKSENGTVGKVFYDLGVIELQETSLTYPISPDTMNETYLHEVIHVILSAMEHKLNSDEKFINLFSKLLYQVLKTSDYPTKEDL